MVPWQWILTALHIHSVFLCLSALFLAAFPSTPPLLNMSTCPHFFHTVRIMQTHGIWGTRLIDFLPPSQANTVFASTPLLSLQHSHCTWTQHLHLLPVYLVASCLPNLPLDYQAKCKLCVVNLSWVQGKPTSSQKEQAWWIPPLCSVHLRVPRFSVLTRESTSQKSYTMMLREFGMSLKGRICQLIWSPDGSLLSAHIPPGCCA